MIFEQRKNQLLVRYLQPDSYETLGIQPPNLKQLEAMFPLLPADMVKGKEEALIIDQLDVILSAQHILVWPPMCQHIREMQSTRVERSTARALLREDHMCAVFQVSA